MTVDVGNTSAKLTVMEGPDSVVSVTVPEVTQGAVTGMLQDTGAAGVISCSVGPDISGILAAVCASRDLPYVSLDADTPVPVEVDYDRAGLGADRLAAAVGVAEPDRCWLIADAGTALTLDMTRGMTFAGGSIAPGMNMRLEALHRFTARLPRVQVPRELPEGSFLGHDTTSAMILGAVYGIVGSISYYKNHLPSDTRVVMTGGWAGELSRLCDFDVTVDPHLVSKGLNRILIYNENI